MLLPSLGLLVGLAVLVFAADQFVIGAVRIAARLRLSTVVIGAVIIGFGTSAPEMVVSGLAASQGNLDISAGNIIGSNIANLTLVLGAAALVTPVLVASPTIRREAPLSLGATAVFALLVQNGLTRVEGVVLLGLLIAILVLMVRSSRAADPEISDEVEEYLGEVVETAAKDTLRTVVGLVGTLAAAQLLVMSARSLASAAGLAEGFVGLTIVAIGTSLPELATSLQAARKGETDLIVGNLLGSNIFNSLAVAGIAALAGPGRVDDPSLTGVAVVLMLAVAVFATISMITGRRVVRAEGMLLLVVYVAMLPLVS